jgi:acyl carrier protein
MTRNEMAAKVRQILLRLAPGFEGAQLQPRASLRRQLAADSMDVLNFVVALAETFDVEIPEQDYAKIDTLDGCLDYLAVALAQRERAGSHG